MKVNQYETDEKRTLELAQPELLVIAGKGDEYHYFCIPAQSKSHHRCPHCGYPVARNQGNMRRDYLDVIRRGDDAAILTISLKFRKSKCENPNCGCVYYPELSFASRYARTTRRLDDVVVRMVLQGGLSYGEISAELEGKLSRQVVGQLFHRRARELDADMSESAAWYRELIEEGPRLFYEGLLTRGHRMQ